MVMAVRAPEITIGQKDDGTDLSRPIQEGSFNEAFDWGKLVTGHWSITKCLKPALPALVRQRIENADAKQTRSGPGARRA